MKHCGEEGFCFYLAQMESVADEFEDETLNLERIVDLDGSSLMENVEIDEGKLIQTDWFDDREPDRAEKECFHDCFDECECRRYFQDTVRCNLFLVPITLSWLSDHQPWHRLTSQSCCWQGSPMVALIDVSVSAPGEVL